ncbi:MAG: RNA polymerase sigma factor RpoD/SigA [Bacteroidales bacterium]|nr:RNA polymerase sigma factor RpoD/SigA [Bacteroidales bacterium]
MRQLKIFQQITRRDENSVSIYFQEVNKCEMVGVDEEAELSYKIRNGDEKALRKLVEANLRFVISVAKQYQSQGLSFADLISEGNVGLIKAAKKFDENQGFKFISYAVWWIRQSIMQAISEQTRIVRLPLNRMSTMKKISKASSYLEQQLEREPSNNELSEFLDIEEELISENDKIKNRQVSFDKPLSLNGESDSCLYDLIPTESFSSPDGELISESVKINLSRALEKLSDREAEIMNLSYGLNNDKVHSLDEIAYLMDISRERVRQIRRVGLIKLNKMISGKIIFQNNL